MKLFSADNVWFLQDAGQALPLLLLQAASFDQLGTKAREAISQF